jgi:hypothetical protein
MIFRVLASVGLLAAGYYVGREVGRIESIREELERTRARGGRVVDQDGDPAPEEPRPGALGDASPWPEQG